MSRLFIIIFLFLYQMSFSQSFDNIIEKAEYFSSQENYYSAIPLYKKALNKKPNQTDIIYQYAEALRQTYNYQEALKYYQKVYSINSDYKDVKLWMGVLNKNMSNYDLSVSFLNEFILSKSFDEILYKKALVEIAANKLIKDLKEDSLVQINRLNNNINSEFSELSPHYYKDTLYYNSIRENTDNNYKSIVFYSLFKGDKFIYNQEFSLIEDDDMHISNLFIDTLTQRFYFNKCDLSNNKFLCQLYYSDFTSPNNHVYISDINISNFSSTQPFVSNWQGNNVLFFTSDRNKGYGGLDIWVSYINNNSHGTPINLGPEINTFGDEISPFYDVIEDNFYFSSDWHMGFGGFDIFKIKWEGDHWGKTHNMGKGINSIYNDLYLKFKHEENYKIGFLSSNREGSLNISDDFCCNDIYGFKILNNCNCDTIKIKEYTFNKLLPLKIYFDNDKPEKLKNDTISNKDYLFYYNNYLKKRKEFVDFYSSGLEGRFYKNAVDNMNYFFDTEILKGKRHLDKLLIELEDLLKNDKNIKLIFKGFTSPLTSKEYNKALSKRRIHSVEKYIKKYNNGSLNKFFKNGQINIIMMPFGEDLAPRFINDNPKDIKKSIFGINASRERRVEIVKIEVN